MDPLALISLGQLLAIAPFLGYMDASSLGYCGTIAASTVTSYLWHESKEDWDAAPTIPYYTASYLWFNYDIYMAYNHTVKPYLTFNVVMLNLLVTYLGLSIEKDNKYVANKALWYLVSIGKSFFISYLLATNFVLST